LTLTLERVLVTQDTFHLRADLAVAQGLQVAVLGPSGAGKSTLLAVISGFIAPAAGRVLIAGTDVSALAPGQRPVSIVFQDRNLFAHLTVAQNVGLGLRPDLRLSAAERGRVHASLARVGLGGMEERKPAALSGGQRSRVALARVLLRARPLLLLDEPFSALGPALKAEMLDLVAGIAEEAGSTVLMVTHDPADARRFARQTILVAEGRAHPPQATRALLDTPPESLRHYLG